MASSASRSSMVAYDAAIPSRSAARAELPGDDDVMPSSEPRAERDARLCTSAMKPPPTKPTERAGRARVTSVVMSSILTQVAHLLPLNAQKCFASNSIVGYWSGLVGVVY